MKRFILRRILEMIPTTAGILILTFILFYVVGGSPAQTILGQHATQEAIAAFDAQNGYDKPLFCGNWYKINALRKNSAELAFPLSAGSYKFDRPVKVMLADSKTFSPVCTEFTVPTGQKIVKIEGSLNLVRRKTDGFFDSQFISYLKSLMRLDFGISIESHRPVLEVLKTGVGPSLSLSIPILFFGTFCGLLLGLICAAGRSGATDKIILGFSTLLMSVNYVVWILIGQFVLGFKLNWFPIWGYESAYYLILPVIIGVISFLGQDLRYYRAVILDEIYKPYVRTAQAKGLTENRVLFRHVMQNSMIPIVTYVSLSIPYLFTGSLLLENFFGIPGLGSVSLNAINTSDMSVVRGVVIIGALIYQIVNLVTDLCYGWLDPRVRIAS